MVEIGPEIHNRSPKKIVKERIRHVEKIGNTKFIDISPENPKDVPIVFLPGWSADIKTLGAFYKGAIEKDRRIITEEYPVEPRNSLPAADIEGASVSGQANAQSMADYLEAKGIDTVKAIGHSEGAGITLTLVEELKRRNIKLEAAVLVAPTGVGKPTADRLQKGVQDMMLKNELNRTLRHPIRLSKDYLSIIKSGIKFGIKHGKEGIREGHDIANIDMVTLLENALEEGVDIGILQSGDKDNGPFNIERLSGEIPETDPLVHIADLAFDTASAQQKMREQAVTKLREAIPDLLTNPEARKRFDDQVTQFMEKEETAPLVMSSPDAGHLFLDYIPGTYIPHAIEMLDYLSSQRKNSDAAPAEISTPPQGTSRDNINKIQS